MSHFKNSHYISCRKLHEGVDSTWIIYVYLYTHIHTYFIYIHILHEWFTPYSKYEHILHTLSPNVMKGQKKFPPRSTRLVLLKKRVRFMHIPLLWSWKEASAAVLQLCMDWLLVYGTMSTWERTSKHGNDCGSIYDITWYHNRLQRLNWWVSRRTG